eukprot:9513-Pelagomonas_calceolata.AAC.2
MGMFVYVLWFNAQQEPAKRTWHGWSRECLTDWVTYIQVAIPSMVMICLVGGVPLLLPCVESLENVDNRATWV